MLPSPCSIEGICIVISPLIALMNDQVRFLKSKGIKSVAITSNMHITEIDTSLTNCIYGGVKFLYLSPEKLQTELRESNESKEAYSSNLTTEKGIRNTQERKIQTHWEEMFSRNVLRMA